MVLAVFFLGKAVCSGGEEAPATKRPIEGAARTEINGLPVKYVRLDTGQFAPAYVDATRGVLYVWRDVLLQAEQVPNAGGPHHRTPIIDIAKTSLDVREIDPEVRYTLGDRGVWFGYYDRSSMTFFRWKDITMEGKASIPEGYREFSVGERQGATIRRTVEIPIPLRLFHALFCQE